MGVEEQLMDMDSVDYFTFRIGGDQRNTCLRSGQNLITLLNCSLLLKDMITVVLGSCDGHCETNSGETST